MTDFDTRIDGGAVVIRPVGRLDMVAAPVFRSLVDQTVAAGNVQVVLDFSATEFIDSSGLGAVVGGLKAARQVGGDLRIACVSGTVWTVFTLTTLDKVFRAYPSVEEALGAPG